MPLVLPYPNKPANGDTLDATVVQANFTAIAQAIQSFDGSQIQAATIQASAMADAANPIKRGLESFFDYVYSGGVIAATGGLGITISGGVFYILGNRLVFAGVGAQTLAANKDVYIDVDNLGNVVYQSVSNNTAAPSITANSIRLGIVITGAATITAINQGLETAVLPIVSGIPMSVQDSLGNLICPRDPIRRTLGYRQLTSVFSTASTSPVQVTPLSCPVIVPTGRRVKITAGTPLLQSSGSPNNIFMSIWDGVVASGTQLQAHQGLVNTSSNGNGASMMVPTTPATPSKTYNVGMTSTPATTTSFQPSATSPAYILVELN